jgi:hypothetical protein
MALKDWKRKPKIVKHIASFSRWQKDDGKKLFSITSWKGLHIHQAYPSTWSGFRPEQTKTFPTYAKALAHAKSYMRRH